MSVINPKYNVPRNMHLLFNSQGKIVKFLFGGTLYTSSVIIKLSWWSGGAVM